MSIDNCINQLHVYGDTDDIAAFTAATGMDADEPGPDALCGGLMQVGDVEATDDGIMIEFVTPWEAPTDWVAATSKLYPELEFRLEWLDPLEQNTWWESYHLGICRAEGHKIDWA